MSRLSGLRKDIVPDNAGTQWLSYSQSVSQQNLFFFKASLCGAFYVRRYIANIRHKYFQIVIFALFCFRPLPYFLCKYMQKEIGVQKGDKMRWMNTK